MGDVAKCAYCGVFACYRGEVERAPDFCPMKSLGDVLDRARNEYFKSDHLRRLAVCASMVEGEGYMKWPRLREVIEYAKKLGIKKIGIAFCIGLRSEARLVSRALENAGFNVYSVCCKVGGINKGDVGLSREYWLSKRDFEAICNPVGQAMVLNAIGTELNIVVGLCVGHDSIFYMYSKAPVVTLIAKDRVTGHNPVAVIYSGYYKRLFGLN